MSNLEEWIPAGLRAWVTVQQAVDWSSAALIFIVGWIGARLVAGTLSRVVGARMSAQAAMVTRLAVYYSLMVMVVIATFGRLGIDLSVLLGAAGVLTVALGFAAQTSASNLISGVFLLGEQPFVVGDVIEVGGTVGEVVSIDPMSVKLRTYSNVLVRVPNESLLKSEIVNLTHFPIRRVDIPLRVDHEADLAHVRRVLQGVAEEDAMCLDEPRPEVWFKEFELDGVLLQFSLWSATKHFLELRNRIPDHVKLAFDREGIELAKPMRKVILR